MNGASFSIGKILAKSKDLAITHYFFLFPLTALAWIASLPYVITSMYETPPQGAETLFWHLGWLGLVGIVFQIALSLAVIRLYLDLVRDGKTNYGRIKKVAPVAVTYILALVAYTAAVFLGLLALIIPGIIVMLMFLFVPYLVVDRKAGIHESFAKSREMTAGLRWKLLGLTLILVAIMVVFSLIPLGLGALITFPFWNFVYTYAYTLALDRKGSA